MPNQPNPFVNPNQRGVALPLGCKNLMDVLKITGGRDFGAVGSVAFPADPVTASFVQQGKMKAEIGHVNDVAPHFSNFFEGGTRGKMFTITSPEAEIFVAAVTRSNELILCLFIGEDQIAAREVLRDTFENPRFGWKCAGKELAQASLGLDINEAARKVMKLMVDGFGVSDDERLTFHMYEGV